MSFAFIPKLIEFMETSSVSGLTINKDMSTTGMILACSSTKLDLEVVLSVIMEILFINSRIYLNNSEIRHGDKNTSSLDLKTSLVSSM